MLNLLVPVEAACTAFPVLPSPTRILTGSALFVHNWDLGYKSNFYVLIYTVNILSSLQVIIAIRCF